MNFETEPPAPWTPLRILTLPSGAVSSSWMWNRLMSVFTVIVTRLYFTFSLLLTRRKSEYHDRGPDRAADAADPRRG